MSRTMIRDARECEAIDVLRRIIEGTDEQLAPAIAQGRLLLRALRQPRTGATLRAVTPAQLRDIARLRGQGKTEHGIARELTVPRWAVHYHLKPSQAMQDALMEANP